MGASHVRERSAVQRAEALSEEVVVLRDAVAEAGPYTRPLLSSTLAVSDTRKPPTHPKHP